ncbi:MAG: hypothetical protein QOK06_2987 [Acidimicrobiaceae bacterium]
MDSSPDVLERTKVREVAGVFHRRWAIEAAVEDLLLNGFDRADIDRLAGLDEVRRRLKVYVSPEEAADLTPAPRQPVFKRDDITAALVATVSVIGAAAGVAAAFGILVSGGGGWSAGVIGTLVGLGAGGIAALVMARVFRREDLSGLEWLDFDRGVVLWVRVRSAEREAMAQDILRRNGGRAVRIHEIDLEKRAEDLPLSSLRPDPWLGSEPLGHP